MFYDNDPDGSVYKTRTHFAEVIEILRPPAARLVQKRFTEQEVF